LIQACHPFPTALVVMLTFLIGAVSSLNDIDAASLALACLAVLLSQLSIGWSNDYLDRGRDALYQPEKPIAAGLISPALVRLLAGVALVGALAIGAALGPAALALLVAGTSCGLAYNLFLKDTRWSWAPYILGFAALPFFVWSALDNFRDEYLALYPIGAPLVLAVHIANALPDIEADEAAGARSLAVSLGRQQALRLLFACLLLPLLTIALSAIWLDYDFLAFGVTFAAYGVLTALAFRAYSDSSFTSGASRGFRLVALAAVVLATGWLAAV
jgi:4-hydroxybenzoate polyprenyltransferase